LGLRTDIQDQPAAETCGRVALPPSEFAAQWTPYYYPPKSAQNAKKFNREGAKDAKEDTKEFILIFPSRFPSRSLRLRGWFGCGSAALWQLMFEKVPGILPELCVETKLYQSDE
jgi:hypothetical protein